MAPVFEPGLTTYFNKCPNKSLRLLHYYNSCAAANERGRNTANKSIGWGWRTEEENWIL